MITKEKINRQMFKRVYNPLLKKIVPNAFNCLSLHVNRMFFSLQQSEGSLHEVLDRSLKDELK